jgi:pimeloyl-ACP methyl ester carboxylesterase
MITASQSFATHQPKDKIIILVAGFFNSFAPEYFSDDIIQALKAKGFKVIVAEKLNPVGTIEDNGERVLKILNAVHLKNPNADMTALGHSAGGLYALYAINKGAHYIKNLITVSTPFDGVEFIERLRDRSDIIKDLSDLCFLDGLRQLTKPFVRHFLSSIKVPSTLKIHAFGGYQPVDLNIFDAANMSAVLSVTDSYITGKSDGIVGYSSSVASALIPTLENSTIKINTNPAALKLEHWEQVLDYKNFILLGTPNIELIQERQFKFYSSVADLMLTL